MKPRRITPLILCGGAGTRLWPVSTDELPKQFINLLGTRSTFQDAVCRVADEALFESPVVVTGENYHDLVRSQLNGVDAGGTILLEPARRNSGPAIAAATAHIAARDPQALVLVMASDHVIRQEEEFRAAVRTAATAAEEGFIVTFGIRPDRPATGYGYIHAEAAEITPGVRRVERFVEKPDAATATAYIADGYLWNSGNFLFRADALLAEYARFDPATVDAARRAAAEAIVGDGMARFAPEAFLACGATSIDYAVMEKSALAAVVPVSMGWSDVGSWHAVWELLERDEAGNAAQGPAVFLDSENNFVRTDGAPVCLLGVKNLAVLATAGAVLVYDREHEGAIRAAVARLSELTRG